MNAKQYYDSIKAERFAWANSQPRACMWCGLPESWPGLQIHEICRRSAAPNRWWRSSTALLLCNDCHSGIFSAMCHAKQLCLKMMADPENYCLADWLEIGKMPETRVTQKDVQSFVGEMPSRYLPENEHNRQGGSVRNALLQAAQNRNDGRKKKEIQF